MDRAEQQIMSARDTKSFTETVKTYGAQLLRFVKARVKRTAEAEDILQEVWYQFSRVTNIDDLGNAGAWLYSVTRNKITDSYRKKKHESLEELADEGDFSISVRLYIRAILCIFGIVFC